MRILAFVAAALVLLALSAPALAHHNPGHRGGPPWTRDDSSANPLDHDNDSANEEPLEGPGNSGAAHWCKANYAELGFRNHGQCVSHYAHERKGEIADDDPDNVEEELENESENSNSEGRSSQGALAILEVEVNDDGTFSLEGKGAEDQVTAWIAGGSGAVVAFGDATPASDGTFTIEGEWACQVNDADQEARLRVRDSDERVSQTVTFPCEGFEL